MLKFENAWKGMPTNNLLFIYVYTNIILQCNVKHKLSIHKYLLILNWDQNLTFFLYDFAPSQGARRPRCLRPLCSLLKDFELSHGLLNSWLYYGQVECLWVCTDKQKWFSSANFLVPIWLSKLYQSENAHFKPHNL